MSEEFHSFTPRPPSPTVEELDDEARAFLTEAIEVAQALGLPEDVAELSRIFAERREQWYATASEERPDPNDFVTAVSALVAQRLAITLSLDWVRYTDDDGTDLALVVPAERVHEEQNLYIFPLDGVAARWPEEAEGDVLAYYEGVVATVRAELRD